MARTGVAGSTVRLGIKYYSNGTLFDPHYVGAVKIYTAETGGTLLDTIVPSHISVGYYQITWSIPSSLAAGTYYDQHEWQAEEGMAYKTQRYSFTVTIEEEEEVEDTGDNVVETDVVIREKPTWMHGIGLENTEDLGNGCGVSLVWRDAIPANPTNTVHYNIYYADTRFGVFGDTWPKAITAQTYGSINVPPGNMYYFAVRATEFDTSSFDITQLTQIASGVYEYPEEQTLLADIDAYGAGLVVDDASSYPTKGYLQVEYEVLYYASRTDTTFTVDEIYRGAYQTVQAAHTTGATVKLFKGVEDGNSVIVAGTAAWTKENGPPRNVSAVGEFNVDSDGYRTNATDIVTTDLTASDANTADFPNYDYNSYHRPSMQAYFKGECINSYAWGELGGLRGVGLQDQNLARLDMMLQTAGEGVVLLRRKQTGKRCRCIDLRHEHPQARCEYCYGTGFEGGYDRYTNTRAISEYETNTQGKILIRVNPYDDDVKLDPANGIMQISELTAWTINIPTIKDRSMIVRFNEDGSEEFRYECLNVTRSRLMFGLTGQQTFKIKRLDKTSIIYTFDWEI